MSWQWKTSLNRALIKHQAELNAHFLLRLLGVSQAVLFHACTLNGSGGQRPWGWFHGLA
jgi:hypothetical protein